MKHQPPHENDKESLLGSIQRRPFLKVAGTGLSTILAGAGVGGELATPASAASPDIIEDFEDGDLDEYTFDRGSSGASVVTSPTYNGSYALQISDTDTEMISTSGLATYPSAGDTFTFRFKSASNKVGNLTYGVQDHENRYFIQLDFPDGYFKIAKVEAGDGGTINKAENVTFSTGIWYDVEVQWAADGTHTATLYDDTGSQIVQTTATDTTWTSGGVGFDGYYEGGGTAHYDYVTLDTSGDSSSMFPVIEDFEDGDLDEYTFDRGSSGASLTSSLTYEGSYALQISDTHTELISTSGLETYPVSGDTIRYRFQSDSSAAANLSYGVQDHDNRYFIQLDFLDGYFKLGKITSAGNEDNAADNVSYSTDIWYDVEVQWGRDGTHVATLYDETGTQIAQTSYEDTTWTTGGIGFDGYYGKVGGSGYYDHVTISRTETLGSFENNHDGWLINSGGQLEQTMQENFPAGVRVGESGLLVRPGSTNAPLLENSNRVEVANFEENPYLCAGVLPGFAESSADITCELRYYRSDTSGMEASKTYQVPAGKQRLIHWDMSSLSTDALANPGKLEICWYPVDQPPGSDGSFDYDGAAIFDRIHLTDDPAVAGEKASTEEIENLQLKRGMITQFNTQTMDQSTESGSIQFSDGTSVPYSFEILGSDQYEYTIDGEVYKLGGGW